jgi:hypothetical protein
MRRTEFMRSDRTLIKIVLDNMDKLETGLCWLIKQLMNDGEINRDEYLRLTNIINDNIYTTNKHFPFFFKKGAKGPRTKFLNKLLKDL